MFSIVGIYKFIQKRAIEKFVPTSYSSQWPRPFIDEPDYLALAKSEIPEYEIINVQIKGYDFVILEKYQSKIHKFARLLSLDVTDSWANEVKKIQVTTGKRKGQLSNCEYDLKEYERNIQVKNILSYEMPPFIDLILTTCPPGVNLRIHLHESIHYEERFVPQLKLKQLKEELSQDLTKKS